MTGVKPAVVVTHWVHPEVLAFLASHFQVVANQTDETWPRAEVLARCRDADGAMMFMPDWVDGAFVEACPRLRIVSAALKGYDNFDVQALTRRRVWLTIVPDLLAIPTAELGIGLLLALTRNLLRGDRLIRDSQFHGWRPQLYGTELTGRNAGLIGMGGVGRELAGRLKPLQLSMLYADERRLGDAEEALYGVRYASPEGLLAASDFVFLLLPLTAGTRHYLNAARLAGMKRGAYLINVARGSLVCEREVAEALRSGHLAGYAADVFEMEDWALVDKPRSIATDLLAADLNTVFTPHLGSATHAARRDIAMAAARELVSVLIEGNPPRHAVNRPPLGPADAASARS
jgi:phosphonate dehydrogenase